MAMTRESHLEWCKERAHAYVDADQMSNAFASIISDLGKHPETEGHADMELGMMLREAGKLDTESEMREFIEGFN